MHAAVNLILWSGRLEMEARKNAPWWAVESTAMAVATFRSLYGQRKGQNLSAAAKPPPKILTGPPLLRNNLAR